MNQDFLREWSQLEHWAQSQQLKNLQSAFKEDPNRVAYFSFEVADIFVDFSKNWMSRESFNSLIKLAKHAKLQEKIQALFSGQAINTSENKAATHTLQRKTASTAEIIHNRQKMYVVAKNYRTGAWKSAFGKKIQAIVNIGIGGSYLGPKLTVEALSDLQTNNDIKVLFYPSVDSVTLRLILQQIDLKSTLFCLGSKSLGTIESIRNSKTILDLLKKETGYKPSQTRQSFVAATTNATKAYQLLDIPNTHVMPFDAAVGGRFSVWSSIGFPLLLCIGEQKFIEFLQGAECMDNHFEKTDFKENLPVIMAMISIWYRNFMQLPAYAVIPYDMRLKSLPGWLQQLTMESNGKMIGIDGAALKHSTSPWLFGDHGQLSQHAFFQTFHQGKDILPIDFVGVVENDSNQEFLLVNMLAQSAALMSGEKNTEIQNQCPGNRPSTTLIINKLTPSSLGQLLALYEHMVFVQSVIWNINCFDQPGVELGKKLAHTIVNHLEKGCLNQLQLDASTQQLLKRTLTNNNLLL